MIFEPTPQIPFGGDPRVYFFAVVYVVNLDVMWGRKDRNRRLEITWVSTPIKKSIIERAGSYLEIASSDLNNTLSMD
jgi:hypothetical protein